MAFPHHPWRNPNIDIRSRDNGSVAAAATTALGAGTGESGRTICTSTEPMRTMGPVAALSPDGGRDGISGGRSRGGSGIATA